MKYPLLLIFIFNFGLCRCAGTEVGNGVKKDESPAETPDLGQEQSNSPPKTGAVHGGISLFLFVSCASPFAENIAGTFSDLLGQAVFEVVMSSDSQREVTAILSQQLIKIKLSPTGASPYAIEALEFSPQLSCGPITSQTLADGKIERSVQLSDQTQLSWTLEGISVKSIKLIHPDSREEVWMKKSN